MKMRPVVRWTSNVNGFLKPSAQIARLIPVVLLKKGLSLGIMPSRLMRSIFPSGVPRLCAFDPTAFSPTAM